MGSSETWTTPADPRTDLHNDVVGKYPRTLVRDQQDLVTYSLVISIATSSDIELCDPGLKDRYLLLTSLHRSLSDSLFETLFDRRRSTGLCHALQCSSQLDVRLPSDHMALRRSTLWDPP